ncbi:MAG: transcriptional repressor [Ignavibacteria bacterium]|nr:transcriptional repressor [Ignavibacteria bacterium]MCU7515839.1 transcriptional repressor [Ignavibacteria bacterium]
MKAEAEEKFREFLKNGKNRITPERFEVLNAALDYQGHFGADDLYIAMKKMNSSVSRATVYNTVELLEQCQIISKRNFGDNMNRYESCFGKMNHEHLVCTTCGKIIEFSTPRLEAIIEEVCRQNGFEMTNYTFNIFGKCSDKNCSKKDE